MELSNPERNPDATLRLLSLDGGGVRGLSSLMVLDDLMESIALEEKRLGRRSQGNHDPLKPCDYFDLYDTLPKLLLQLANSYQGLAAHLQAV